MIDKNGRNIDYLRLSVTELCNLRCRYCMDEDGICKVKHEEILTFEEMILASKAAVSLGVKKIRITGGEPLIKKDIISLCSKIGKIEGLQEFCMTTNGVLLPEYVSQLKECGIRRINISLDTLDKDKFRFITRLGNVEDSVLGIKAALDGGFEKVKLNAVLIRGFNEEDIIPLSKLTMEYPLDVRFIELMPMLSKGGFSSENYMPSSEAISILKKELNIKEARRDGVASLYKIEGSLGNVGFISPISNHFCNECSRIRITADGHVKPCLHSKDEYRIKGLLYDEMVRTIQMAIESKPENHGILDFDNPSSAGREMNRIGG